MSYTNILQSCRRILWYDSWLTWMIISATHFSFPLKTNGLKSLWLICLKLSTSLHSLYSCPQLFISADLNWASIKPLQTKPVISYHHVSDKHVSCCLSLLSVSGILNIKYLCLYSGWCIKAVHINRWEAHKGNLSVCTGWTETVFLALGPDYQTNCVASTKVSAFYNSTWDRLSLTFSFSSHVCAHSLVEIFYITRSYLACEYAIVRTAVCVHLTSDFIKLLVLITKWVVQGQ